SSKDISRLIASVKMSSSPPSRLAKYIYHIEPVHASLLPSAIGLTPLSFNVETTSFNSSNVSASSKPYSSTISPLYNTEERFNSNGTPDDVSSTENASSVPDTKSSSSITASRDAYMSPST